MTVSQGHDWVVYKLGELLGSVGHHDRFGSSYDTSINGHLHYHNDIDRSLNESVTDKIRKYRADYNNNPPNVIAFMSDIASTSGRLHSEFVRLLFVQTHRETDRFFTASGVQLCNLPVTSCTSSVRRSPHSLNRKSATFSPKMKHSG